MSLVEHTTTRRSDSPNPLYWVATGVFCILFVGSVYLTISGPEETVRVTVFLGYPAWVIYPQAVAKALGVLTIIVNAVTNGRFATLTVFAFAGFLFDLLLALGGHISRSDPQVWLAVVGLILWVAAFAAYLVRFRARPLTTPSPTD